LAAIATATTLLAIASGTEMLLEGNTTSFALWFFIGAGSLLATPGAAKLDLVEMPEVSPGGGLGTDEIGADAVVPEVVSVGS
jgi:hypothetical protein